MEETVSFLFLQLLMYKTKTKKQKIKYDLGCINFFQFIHINKHLCQYKYTGIDDKNCKLILLIVAGVLNQNHVPVYLITGDWSEIHFIYPCPVFKVCINYRCIRVIIN